MEKLPYNIKDEYSFELNEIGDILSQLKEGKIYELTNVKMDGFIYTNVDKLEKKLNLLLGKIQNGKEGFESEFFGKINDKINK